MTSPLVAHRTEDGRVRVATSALSSRRPGEWTMTGAEARALAAQLLAATVEDEKFQEGAALGGVALDFGHRVRKLFGS